MICNGCGIDKTIDEFSWKNKAKNLKHKKCKLCTKKVTRTYYENNRGSVIKRVAQRRDDHRLKVKTYYVGYLREHPCIDCGISNILVLEADHLYDKKLNISDMLKNGYSWETILLELAKCEIVCRNCHAIRTYSRVSSYRNSLSQVYDYLENLD